VQADLIDVPVAVRTGKQVIAQLGRYCAGAGAKKHTSKPPNGWYVSSFALLPCSMSAFTLRAVTRACGTQEYPISEQAETASSQDVEAIEKLLSSETTAGGCECTCDAAR